MRTDVLGVGFDPLTMDGAVSLALALMAERRGAYVCTVNPEIVMRCRSDPALMDAVNGADMVTADGIGVVKASKTLKRPLPERVAGYDLFLRLLESAEGGVYLLGGRPGVAEKAAAAIEARFPWIRVCGFCDGYTYDGDAVISEIERCAPALVAVCLGAGKQELFMAAHRGIDAGLMLGLGGTLDVLAGESKRAPLFWRRHGLEWLWRLFREPRRIGRMAKLPLFIIAARIQRLREWKKAD